MTTVQLNPSTKIGLDEILNGISTLKTNELQQFFGQVANLLASRKAPFISAKESELLLRINEGYPFEMKNRYDFLNEKLGSGQITQTEQEEMIELADAFEALDVKRLNDLIELAQLRKIPVENLLKQFSSN